MEADDGHAEERDGVVGAQDSFAIFVNVKDFVKRGEVAHVEVIGTRGDETIEAGLAEF